MAGKYPQFVGGIPACLESGLNQGTACKLAGDKQPQETFILFTWMKHCGFPVDDKKPPCVKIEKYPDNKHNTTQVKGK